MRFELEGCALARNPCASPNRDAGRVPAHGAAFAPLDDKEGVRARLLAIPDYLEARPPGGIDRVRPCSPTSRAG
jgi:hypothetical protein